MSPLVTISDTVWLAIVALCAVVPLAVVFLAAILRGYTIDIHMTRDLKRGFGRRRRHGDDNGDEA